MNVRNIAVLLTADVASYKTQMLSASMVTHQFTNDVEQSGASVSKWGTLAKAGMVAGATLAVVALLGAVSAMSKFETQMRNVNSLTGLSEESFRSFEQRVISLSTRVPQTATQLAEGLYQIASSGFKGAEGFKVLEASAIAASAGLSTTMVSSKAILAVLNAYGLSAEHAAEVGNILFQGVNVGIFSFDQLAEHIGDVLPVASLMNVSLEQVTGALAGISLSGIDVAEGTTSLTRVIQSFIKPSKEMSAQLKSMGYESGSSALAQNTLYQMMEKLRESSGGNVETIRAWFPEIRAQRGAMALMTNEGKNYTNSINAMTDANKGAGAMFEVFAEQMKAPAAQAKLLWNSITAGAITAGIAMIPALTWLIDGVRSFGRMLLEVGDRVQPFFQGLRTAAGDVVSIGGDLTDMFKPFAAVLLTIVGAPVTGTLNVLGTALAELTGFLSEHAEVVFMVATAYVGFKTAALAAMIWPKIVAGVNMATLAFTQMTLAMQAAGAAHGLTGLQYAISSILTTSVSTEAAVGGIFAGVAVGAALAIKSLQKSQQDGEENAKEYYDSLKIDDQDVQSITQAMSAIRVKVETLRATLKGKSGLDEYLQNLNPWADNTIRETAKEIDAYDAQSDALARLAEAQYAETRARQDAIAAREAGVATQKQLNDLNLQAYDDTIKQARAELSLQSAIAKLNEDQEKYLENQRIIAGTSQQIIDIRNDAAAAADANAKAEENAAQALDDATYSQTQATAAVAAAEFGLQNALWGREEAVRGVQQAEDSLQGLEAQSLQLTRDLTQARKDAAEALVSMDRAARGDAISLQEAQFALEDAIRRAEEGPSGSQWDDPNAQAKLDLAVEQAQLALEEAQARATASQEELTAAQQAGVEGSPQVLAAQEAIANNASDIADAQHSLTVAQRGLINADHAVSTAHDGVASAQRGVETATRRVTQAEKDLAAARDKTVKDAQVAADKIKTLQDDAVKNSDALKRAVTGDMLDIAEAGKAANREIAIMYALLAGISGGLPPELKAIVDSILADLKPMDNNNGLNPGPNPDGTAGWTADETGPSGPLPGPNPDGTSGYWPEETTPPIGGMHDPDSWTRSRLMTSYVHPRVSPTDGGTIRVVVENIKDMQPAGAVTNAPTIVAKGTDADDVVRAWNREFARPGL